MLDTVKINHVQHISFTQSRLTDAVSVILSELLSYEHPSKGAACFFIDEGFRSEPRVLPTCGGKNTRSPRKVFLRRTRRKKRISIYSRLASRELCETFLPSTAARRVGGFFVRAAEQVVDAGAVKIRQTDEHVRMSRLPIS